jgi:hypothetical protein
LWVEIFEGLDLPAGLIRDENAREDAVRRLQAVVQSELNRVATIQGRIQQGIQLWNRALFSDRRLVMEKDGLVSSASKDSVSLPHDTFNPPLRHYKEMLETLTRFNTPGRLRNLRLNAAGHSARAGRAANSARGLRPCCKRWSDCSRSPAT